MLTYPFIGKTLSELVANILVGKYAPVDRYVISPLLLLSFFSSPLSPQLLKFRKLVRATVEIL